MKINLWSFHDGSLTLQIGSQKLKAIKKQEKPEINIWYLLN